MSPMRAKASVVTSPGTIDQDVGLTMVFLTMHSLTDR
jgi:hypothetical protein